jgi:hypothetical protein
MRALAEFGDRYAELRFGQMVANLVTMYQRPATQQEWAAAVWDIEDEELLATIREHLQEWGGVPRGEQANSGALGLPSELRSQEDATTSRP